MAEIGFELMHDHNGVPVKSWTKGVPFDSRSKEQVRNLAQMPFMHGHIAIMPDVHFGMGATIGSVIPTRKAIMPAAVGVDIGCGMVATRLSLSASDLPDNLRAVRKAIEWAVPHGGPGRKGSWIAKNRRDGVPDPVAAIWKQQYEGRYVRLTDAHPNCASDYTAQQLGTLGTGNHFVELCLDEQDRVWVMLHSGSRGLGNRLGMYFISEAREEMLQNDVHLPDENLAFLEEGSTLFNDYWDAVSLAQDFAATNRQIMLSNTLQALQGQLKPFTAETKAINCHHNYVTVETHFGEQVYVTRKGAVRAGKDEMGIIPGSMGAKSFIVRGLGNEESLCSCSHGAGRVMSRAQAKKEVSLADHVKALEGVECRKDSGVLDETPAAYKDIDSVMAAQQDLVSIEHVLKQVVCVKG